MRDDDHNPQLTGDLDGPHAEEATERARRRKSEERAWVPVILKRSDEARRHPDDLLVLAISAGLEQLNRPAVSLVLSAVAAGLILGFSAMAVAVVKVATDQAAWPMLERILSSMVYPFGFVICLMSGTELFTEHTATAVYPVLDRQSTIARLIRLWFLVMFGNLVGAFISALLLTGADPVVGARRGYLGIGLKLIDVESLPLLASALLAGWLMALGAWLILATPPAVSQIVSIYIVTALIGVGGLHHSIAGAVELFTYLLMADDPAIVSGLRFLGLALVGNLIGGSLFVAVLNYGHIRKSQET